MKLDERLKLFSMRYKKIKADAHVVSEEMAAFDKEFMDMVKEEFKAEGDLHTSDLLLKYREAMAHEQKKEIFIP